MDSSQRIQDEVEMWLQARKIPQLNNKLGSLLRHKLSRMSPEPASGFGPLHPLGGLRKYHSWLAKDTRHSPQRNWHQDRWSVSTWSFASFSPKPNISLSLLKLTGLTQEHKAVKSWLSWLTPAVLVCFRPPLAANSFSKIDPNLNCKD